DWTNVHDCRGVAARQYGRLRSTDWCRSGRILIMTARKKTMAKSEVAKRAASGDSSDGDYAGGYGRPPLATRFRTGQSGNPNGRPPGRSNVKTMVERVIHRKVPVREGEQTRELPILEAILQAQAVKAIKGDARSAALIISLVKPGLSTEQGE